MSRQPVSKETKNTKIKWFKINWNQDIYSYSIKNPKDTKRISSKNVIVGIKNFHNCNLLMKPKLKVSITIVKKLFWIRFNLFGFDKGNCQKDNCFSKSLIQGKFSP